MMIVKGFKFGMLLQLAIGPVCIFIFHVASITGFLSSELAVLGTFITDGAFILIAAIGLCSVIKKKNLMMLIKVLGMIILCIFGVGIILAEFNYQLLPSISIVKNDYTSKNTFIQSVILTASNPLTIIFWSGVFSSKIVEEGLSKNQIYLFGFGASLATLFFLSFIAVLGSVCKIFISADVISFLNILVGLLIIYFGTKLAFKKI